MMDGQSRSRFVCPNDRQLTLRAKLKTGWSVKTGSLGYHSENTECTLDSEEQETIIQVIKRAEQLELREQERIGRLVDRLENMRKYALGRSPTQCLLCGDRFSILGAQSVICIACRKLVCQKCAIETSDTIRHAQNSKDQWLCKICAETKEMWKKSGAWFFKSLPKYILPDQVDKTKTVPVSPKSKEDDSSSEDDKPKFLMKSKRKPSILEAPVSGHAEAVSQQTSDTFSRQTSSSDSQKSLGFSNLSDIQEKWDTDSSVDFSLSSRRESVASKSYSEWCGEDRYFHGSTSIASSLVSFKTMQPEYQKPAIDPKLGVIELSLTYNSVTDTLHCIVHKAKNLLPMDINGLSDPFCKLNILPERKLSTRLRTKTVHKTCNPVFNEALTFYEISEGDLTKKNLHILVLDDDKYGNDIMGETKISLAALRVQQCINMTLMLEKPETPENIGTDRNLWFEDLWSRGQILISLTYNTKRRALLVTVIRCVNLLPMDNNGFSDPFVKLQLRPDTHHRKHKTSIKWKNLNPYFNEEFPFDARPNELSTQSLYITVWDKDYGKSNDYLGGLIIGGPCSKGQRLKHWLDMIRYPDHRHECWHHLTEDALTD